LRAEAFLLQSRSPNDPLRSVLGTWPVRKHHQKLDKGEAVDPGSYYFRMNPMFETCVQKYDWMNRIIAIGTGHRLPDGPIYSIFEVF